LKKDPFEHNETQKLSITQAGDVTLTDIKQSVNALFDSLDVSISYKEDSKPFFIDGRCAKVILDGKNVGYLGEVHPEYLVEYILNNSVVTSELDLNLIFDKTFD
ncbi:MAG: hypothetical protein ACOCRX_04205, partial [Candidatus Woesearchaeota archaeon]